MTPRAAGRLAWFLWVMAMAILAAATVLLVMVGFAFPEDAFGFPGFGVVVGVAYATIGALVASRRPSNAIGWLFLAIALFSNVQELATVYGVLAFEQGVGVPGAVYAAWVVDWIDIPIIGGTLVFLFLLFPQGRLHGLGDRTVAGLGATGMTLAIAGLAFKPGPLGIFPAVENPVALIGSTDVAEALELGIPLMLLAGLLAVVGMLRRWRRSTGLEQQQYKWLLAAGGLIALTLAFSVVAFGFELLDTERWWLLAQSLLVLGFTAIPVAVGIAILRYRLYEIDRLVSRTVAYALVIGALVAVYAGGVMLLRSVFPLQGGLAVAASTLAVAALFNPLRRRVQVRVDRRFNRARYDAEQVVAALRERLRHEVDLDDVLAATRDAVARSVAPAHLSLWVRDTGAPR